MDANKPAESKKFCLGGEEFVLVMFSKHIVLLSNSHMQIVCNNYVYIYKIFSLKSLCGIFYQFRYDQFLLVLDFHLNVYTYKQQWGSLNFNH